jgi:hypothetical protein
MGAPPDPAVEQIRRARDQHHHQQEHAVLGAQPHRGRQRQA